MNPARDPGGIQAALCVLDDPGQELVHVVTTGCIGS